MNYSFKFSVLLISGLISSLLILYACTGSQEKTKKEQKYIEGVVVDGGKSGFRMRDDRGDIIRFAHRSNLEYQPSEFHAYYGDRVGVTCFMKIKGDKKSYKPIKIELISSNPDRIDLSSGVVNGIVRARGVRRYLVYLPENDLTVAFYKKGKVKYFPKGWKANVGNKVRVHFSEDPMRFLTKFECYQIDRLQDDLVSMKNKTKTGDVSEIYVHRAVHKAPDKFDLQLKNGETWTMYSGGETILVPEDLIVLLNETYSVQYYRLLMSDQSIHYVAAKIEKARHY